jgi:hypothetical protein
MWFLCFTDFSNVCRGMKIDEIVKERRNKELNHKATVNSFYRKEVIINLKIFIVSFDSSECYTFINIAVF